MNDTDMLYYIIIPKAFVGLIVPLSCKSGGVICHEYPKRSGVQGALFSKRGCYLILVHYFIVLMNGKRADAGESFRCVSAPQKAYFYYVFNCIKTLKVVKGTNQYLSTKW